jgi:7-cyano-7-deazaguanine reductase
MAGPLGKKVNTPSHFAPEILFPIPRDQQRQGKNLVDQVGVDIWNIHELFWIDKQNHSHHDQISIHIPADSINTVESKSLKLFINSMVHRNFTDLEDVKTEIQLHLEALVKTQIIISKIHLLDDLKFTPVIIGANSELISSKKGTNNIIRFNGFRSLCPVTSQPDIADIYIEGNIHNDDLESIACYLGTFFSKESFHELCIEQILSDLSKAGFKIKKVEGFFERRGGIAIIPIRNTTNY